MSQKKNELPSLRKSPLDFLSRDEARQAVKPVAALDASLTNPYKFESAECAEADDMRTKLLFDLAHVASLEHFRTFLWTELAVILKTPWVMLRGLGR